MRTLRHTVIGATLLLVAVLSVSISAGGWAVVTLDSLPTFVAGQETTVGFTLRQHGNTLLAGMHPSEITFHNVESGQRLAFPAPDDGPQGHYAARVTLPRAGAWEWSINNFGEHPMPSLTVTPVATPAASAASTAGSAIPLRLAYPGMAMLAAIAIVGLALGLRWRSQPSPSRHREWTAGRAAVILHFHRRIQRFMA